MNSLVDQYVTQVQQEKSPKSAQRVNIIPFTKMLKMLNYYYKTQKWTYLDIQKQHGDQK